MEYSGHFDVKISRQIWEIDTFITTHSNGPLPAKYIGVPINSSNDWVCEVNFNTIYKTSAQAPVYGVNGQGIFNKDTIFYAPYYDIKLTLGLVVKPNSVSVHQSKPCFSESNPN